MYTGRSGSSRSRGLGDGSCTWLERNLAHPKSSGVTVELGETHGDGSGTCVNRTLFKKSKHTHHNPRQHGRARTGGCGGTRPDLATSATSGGGACTGSELEGPWQREDQEEGSGTRGSRPSLPFFLSCRRGRWPARHELAGVEGEGRAKSREAGPLGDGPDPAAAGDGRRRGRPWMGPAERPSLRGEKDPRGKRERT